MEQFTLEKYLADPTRKVVTRDGRDVRIICTDKRTTIGFPIVALIPEDNVEDIAYKAEVPATYTTRGKFLSNGDESELDLFFVPQKRSRWVFLYKNLAGDIGASDALTSKEAAVHNMSKYLDTFGLTEITWEE